MTYSVKFTKDSNPDVFAMFVKVIEQLKRRHSTTNPSELIEHCKKDFDVNITVLPNGLMSEYTADFLDEEHYFWFALKWS